MVYPSPNPGTSEIGLSTKEVTDLYATDKIMPEQTTTGIFNQRSNRNLHQAHQILLEQATTEIFVCYRYTIRSFELSRIRTDATSLAVK